MLMPVHSPSRFTMKGDSTDDQLGLGWLALGDCRPCGRNQKQEGEEGK
jgi:hypothetical protein